MSAAKSQKPVIALCYDFDGTLSPGNMQEYDFIPSLKIKPADFWQEAGVQAKKHEADQILCYMKLMLDRTRDTEVRITREGFAEKGATVALFPGVADWFGLINAYARERGAVLEHYIISSGIKEMIEGTVLNKKRYSKKSTPAPTSTINTASPSGRPASSTTRLRHSTCSALTKASRT